MRAWLTGEKMYEGFPLLLRRPAENVPELLRVSYPVLVVVTHEFSKRSPNGLPEPIYNNGLLDMDGELVAVFDAENSGVPVLVETFGGKRNYYFYVSQDVDVERALSAQASRYAAERLSWKTSSDPQWKFIEKYGREYF